MKISKHTPLRKIADFLRVNRQWARKVRDVITGKDDPEIYESVERWVSQCHNEPSRNEKVMTALNEILDGHGTEVIRGDWLNSHHHDIQAEYVNMGDTYSATILLEHHTGNFLATTWGDWVEQNTEKLGLV